MTPFDLSKFWPVWLRRKQAPQARPDATVDQFRLVAEAQQARSLAARALQSNIPAPPQEVVDLQVQRDRLLRDRKDTGPIERRMQSLRKQQLEAGISARNGKAAS